MNENDWEKELKNCDDVAECATQLMDAHRKKVRTYTFLHVTKNDMCMYKLVNIHT